MSPLPTIVIVSLIPIYTAWSALSWSLTYRLYHVTLDYKSCMRLVISRLRRAFSTSQYRRWIFRVSLDVASIIAIDVLNIIHDSQGRWICDKWCTYDFPQLVFARVFARHTIARSFKLLMLTNENSRGWHYWPSGRGQLGYSIILLRFVDRSITPCYKEPTSSRRTYCSSPRAHKLINFR